MKLVLAEKTSVAQSIAKGLEQISVKMVFLWEPARQLVCRSSGGTAQPESYDERYSKWKYADLPIFPSDWKYEVSSGTKKQFGILKKFMARNDVESFV